MDLKKTIGRIAKDKLVGAATNKILPMEEASSGLSKGKATALVVAIAGLVAVLSDYFAG